MSDKTQVVGAIPGTEGNPILLDNWTVMRGSYDEEAPAPNTQLIGTIREHHRDDLQWEIKTHGGSLEVITSLVKEVLPNGIIKTCNTYYKLGKRAA